MRNDRPQPVSDTDLLDEFVAGLEPMEMSYEVKPPLPAGYLTTDATALEAVYARLPARLPLLYETLVLTYRWPRSFLLNDIILAGNPIGPGLNGLISELFRDNVMSNELLRKGFIQFATRGETNYDPICFQAFGLAANDYPVVQLDHEEILCNSRIKIVDRIAGSFREFVQTNTRTRKND